MISEQTGNTFSKQIIQCVIGIVVAAMGMTAALGYVFDISGLVAPFFGIPMQFNASVCLMLMGVSLCALVLHQRALSVACAALTLTIALLSFLQYVFGFSIGIDAAFEITGLPPNSIYPGRIYPDTAVGLSCAAIALISFNQGIVKHSVVTALHWLGVVPMIASLMALGYYALKAADTINGTNLYMPPAAAGALLLLSSALVLQAVAELREAAKPGLATPLAAVFSVGVVISFSLWSWLHASQFDLVKARLEAERDQLSGFAGRVIQQQLSSVERMKNRWELAQDETNPSEWRTEARNFIQDQRGLDALVFVSPGGQVVWLEAVEEFALGDGDALFQTPQFVADIQAATSSGLRSGLRPLMSNDGTFLFTSTLPIRNANNIAGLLVAFIHVGNLLDEVTAVSDMTSFYLTFSVDGTAVYTSTSDVMTFHAATEWTDVTVQGMHWRFGIAPNLAYVQRVRSPVAEIILVLGLGISLLLCWLFIQRNQLRAVTNNVEQTNKSLREEITARNAARAQLKQQERYVRLLLDSTGEGIYGIDLEGRCTFCNAAGLRLLGYESEEQLIGEQLHQLIHHKHPDGTPYPIEECKIYQAFTQGVSTHVDDEVFWRADHSSFPVEYWSYPIQDDAKVVGCVVNFNDVSLRNVEREALRQTETQFRETFQHAPVGIAHVALDGTIIRVNPRFCQTLGYSRQELLGRVLRDITYKEDLAATAENTQHLLDGHSKNFTMQKRYVSKSGNLVWVKLTVSLVTRDDGSPDYLIKILEDESQRRKVEIALQASEERFDLATRGTNDGLWDWNVLTDEVWYAPRFKQLLGYNSEGEFPHLFATFAEHLHPDDYAETMEAVRLHLEQQQPYDIEYRLRNRSGAYRWYRARGESLRNDLGQPVRMAGSIQDVTDRREMLESLRLANQDLLRKTEEVEGFVYIVSHDLRAPLVNIQGFSRELETANKELNELLSQLTLEPAMAQEVRRILDADIPGALRFITAGTSKFERLINALLNLSRTGRQEYRPTVLNVNSLLEETVASLQNTINSLGATVTVGSVPEVFADRTAMEQVFGNLLANALNYLDPSRPGKILIDGKVEGDHCHYWIADNGLGLPAGTEERLFRIFQRFHPQRAKGEGMGLAIVKRIIERHDGEIWVESSVDSGTTFHISLPNKKVEAALAV